MTRHPVTGVCRYAPVTVHALTGVCAGQSTERADWVVGFRGQLNTVEVTAQKRAAPGGGTPRATTSVTPLVSAEGLGRHMLADTTVSHKAEQVTSLSNIGGHL